MATIDLLYLKQLLLFRLPLISFDPLTMYIVGSHTSGPLVSIADNSDLARSLARKLN